MIVLARVYSIFGESRAASRLEARAARAQRVIALQIINCCRKFDAGREEWFFDIYVSLVAAVCNHITEV